MKERRASQKLSSKSIMDPNQNVKCKIVVVGDSQCGKTALLHVFAKDCFPEVSVAGRGFREGGGLRDSPVSRWVSSCFALFTRFSFLSRLSQPLLLSPWLDCRKGKVGWKRLGFGTRLHILLLASETCSVMCAEPGVGRFGFSCLGEPGGASGESGVSERVRVFSVGSGVCGFGGFCWFFFHWGVGRRFSRGCSACVVHLR